MVRLIDGLISFGEDLAEELTPESTHRVSVPILGKVFAVTLAPTLIVGGMASMALSDQWAWFTRRHVGEAEQSIRSTFGNIAASGYSEESKRGIQLEFTEVGVRGVNPDNRLGYDRHGATCVRSDREQCAKDMLGGIAHSAAYHDGDEERFIVVRKKGDLESTFYRSASIDKPENAPEGAIVATSRHSFSVLPGEKDYSNTLHFAITPVDKPTAERLQKLGM